MATDQEVLDAEKNRLDKDTLIAQLAILSDLETNGASIKISISANGEQPFNLATLLASLQTDDQDVIITGLVTNLDTAIKTAIGPDDATANTIRKALKDAQVLLEANITAT